MSLGSTGATQTEPALTDNGPDAFDLLKRYLTPTVASVECINTDWNDDETIKDSVFFEYRVTLPDGRTLRGTVMEELPE